MGELEGGRLSLENTNSGNEIKASVSEDGVMYSCQTLKYSKENVKWRSACRLPMKNGGRMVRAVESLDEQDIRKLSNPFVIKCLPAYRKAKRKVLIVGKETNESARWRVISYVYIQNTNSKF